MGRIVFAIYKPLDGKYNDLLNIVKQHQGILQAENLVTQRPFIVLKSKNQSIIEIFEWQSKEAIEQAHHNKNVMEHWDKFAQVCTYETMHSLEEAHSIFSDFEVIHF